MTIRHVVSFKLASTDAAERTAQAEEAARQLLALKGVVPEIIDIQVGVNSLYPGDNWDLTLSADFASQEALEAYVVNPDHEKVVAYIRSIVSGRAAVDFEV